MTNDDTEPVSSEEDRPTIKAESDESKEELKQFFDPKKAQNRLKRSFLVTLIVGSGLILARPVDGIWTMILAVLVMLGYWIFNQKRAGLSKSTTARGVFGDSFYYLGFLFTFIALVSVMLKLGTAAFDIDSIVGSMGPALITTVVGMAVRIYITQFDPITSEPEIETLTAIGELSGSLISATNRMQTAMETVTASAEKSMQNVTAQNIKLIEESSQANRALIEETTQTNRDALNEIRENAETELEQFVEKLKETDLTPTHERITRINETLAEYELAADELKQFATNISGPIYDELHETLQSFAKAAESLVEMSTEAQTSATEVQNHNAELNAALQTLTQNLHTTEGATDNLAQMEGTIGILNENLREIESTIDRFRNDTASQAALFEVATREVMNFVTKNK
jgi:DNA-binding ferritin-like protein